MLAHSVTKNLSLSSYVVAIALFRDEKKKLHGHFHMF